MRFPLSVALLSLLWLTPAPVLAQAAHETQPLGTATLRAAVNAAAQQVPASATRQRSMGRTWSGVALIGLGAYVSADAATSVCGTNAFGSALAGQSCGQAWTKFGFGLGMIGSGVLLATIFSDVPVAQNVTVSPLPSNEVSEKPGTVQDSRSSDC